MLHHDRPTETTAEVPLVLDVDGTLLRTDLLYETLWAALGHDLLATMRVLILNWTSPARLKRQLRMIAEPNIELLPVCVPVLDLAHQAAQRGRAVHLASGADRKLVDGVAQSLDIPGEHFGSEDPCNLTNATKADFLSRKFGALGYDYAGNSWADLKSWENARKIIAVSPGRKLTNRLTKTGKPVQIVDEKWSFAILLRELRPHQWVKNLLLFLPLLAAHEFQPETVLPVLVAIAGFSLGASSIYIINDLLDLDTDRKHPQKKYRPIASGALPIPVAMVASVILGATALLLTFIVSPVVALLTFGYMIGSLVYSLWLKTRRWVDVLVLACLFLLRVLTGAEASQTDVSGWLLAFVLPVFFTLACVKRTMALARSLRDRKLPGRGYSRNNLKSLEWASRVGIVTAALCFLGYSFSPSAAVLYSNSQLFTLSVVPIVFWLARTVRLSQLGHEDYDPLVFVSHDKVGLVIATMGLAFVFLAV